MEIWTCFIGIYCTWQLYLAPGHEVELVGLRHPNGTDARFVMGSHTSMRDPSVPGRFWYTSNVSVDQRGDMIMEMKEGHQQTSLGEVIGVISRPLGSQSNVVHKIILLYVVEKPRMYITENAGWLTCHIETPLLPHEVIWHVDREEVPVATLMETVREDGTHRWLPQKATSRYPYRVQPGTKVWCIGRILTKRAQSPVHYVLAPTRTGESLPHILGSIPHTELAMLVLLQTLVVFFMTAMGLRYLPGVIAAALRRGLRGGGEFATVSKKIK